MKYLKSLLASLITLISISFFGLYAATKYKSQPKPKNVEKNILDNFWEFKYLFWLIDKTQSQNRHEERVDVNELF